MEEKEWKDKQEKRERERNRDSTLQVAFPHDQRDGQEEARSSIGVFHVGCMNSSTWVIISTNFSLAATWQEDWKHGRGCVLGQEEVGLGRGSCENVAGMQASQVTA